MIDPQELYECAQDPSDYWSQVILEQARRSLRDSFYDFVRALWSSVPGNQPLIDTWFIRVLCDRLQSWYTRESPPNLIVNMPPGHGKSIVGSVLLHAWAWARDPRERMLHASYDRSLATRDSVRCRDVLTSPLYQALFPLKLKGDQDEKTYYATEAGGFRYSTSPRSASTGWRGYVRVFDDPHPAKLHYSPGELEDSITWWVTTMASRLDPRPGFAPLSLVIGQRVDYYDLSGYLLREFGSEWDHLTLATEYEAASAVPLKVPHE